MNPTLIKLSVMLVATTLTINHSSSAAWTKEYAELDPLDLFMVNQDNLGMKQKSKQALNVYAASIRVISNWQNMIMMMT